MKLIEKCKSFYKSQYLSKILFALPFLVLLISGAYCAFLYFRPDFFQDQTGLEPQKR